MRRVVEFAFRQGPVLVAAGIGERVRVQAMFRRIRGKLFVGDQAATCEIDLLRRDQPDLVDQPGQHAHRIGAAREAEQIDAVALLPVVDQEFVGREHVVVEPVAGGEPQHEADIGADPVPRARLRQRADAGIVIHDLARVSLRRLAQAAIELQHIGDVLADLVAGAVAQHDDVARFVMLVHVALHSVVPGKRSATRDP